jgi:Tfp pilus assembly protein PilN
MSITLLSTLLSFFKKMFTDVKMTIIIILVGIMIFGYINKLILEKKIDNKIKENKILQSEIYDLQYEIEVMNKINDDYKESIENLKKQLEEKKKIDKEYQKDTETDKKIIEEIKNESNHKELLERIRNYMPDKFIK